MSDGNWFKRHSAKLGLTIAIAIATTAIGWAWYYGLAQEFAYEQEAGKGYADYSKNGCYKIAEAKEIIPTVEQSDSKPCTPSEKNQKQNENSRDYADLVAQRSSALWAKIMGIAALIGMGLSLVGVALVWTTFRETKEANSIAREIGDAQTRGYISIEGDKGRGWAGQFNNSPDPLFVALTVKNWGGTPCRKVTIKRAIRLLPRYLVESPIGADCSDFEQTITIWPTQDIPAGGAKADRVFNNAEITDALDQNGSNRIYLIASVEYQDFCKTDRITEYLAFIEPSSVVRNAGTIKTWTWAQYPEFNRTT